MGVEITYVMGQFWGGTEHTWACPKILCRELCKAEHMETSLGLWIRVGRRNVLHWVTLLPPGEYD